MRIAISVSCPHKKRPVCWPVGKCDMCILGFQAKCSKQIANKLATSSRFQSRPLVMLSQNRHGKSGSPHRWPECDRACHGRNQEGKPAKQRNPKSVLSSSEPTKQSFTKQSRNFRGLITEHTRARSFAKTKNSKKTPVLGVSYKRHKVRIGPGTPIRAPTTAFFRMVCAFSQD